jgi:CopG family nickel-responsive transcriptional regulator
MDLVRFGVAMESDLLSHLDRIVESRKSTRSEVLRDLVRAEVDRDRSATNAPAAAALTIVYDHHVRDLTERLTELQHELGDRVRSTMHVHLTHHLCLEVIVMHGRAVELQTIAKQILATRGVKRGGLELVTDLSDDHHPHEPKKKRARSAK